MQTRDPMMQQLAIEDGNVEGVPKKRKTTKPPKECTEEQKKQKEFDSSMKKILFYITVRICLSQVLSFHDGTTTYIYICPPSICCKCKDPTSGHQSSHCGLQVDWQGNSASRGSAWIGRFTSDQTPSHSVRLSSKAWEQLAPLLMESMPRRMPSVTSTRVWCLQVSDLWGCVCFTSMHQMYTGVYIYMYVYIYICIYICMYIYVNICVYIYAYIYMYICIYFYISMFVYFTSHCLCNQRSLLPQWVHVDMNIFIYLSIYLSVCLSTYLSIYIIYIHTSIHRYNYNP